MKMRDIVFNIIFKHRHFIFLSTKVAHTFVSLFL